MTRLAWGLIAAFGLSGTVLVLLELVERRRDRLHGPHYMTQIQILKAEKPLKLPAVRALRARKVPHPGWSTLVQFGRRSAKP